jgi:hypothetical protein
MAFSTINKSTDYFNTKIYTGTGSSVSFTGVGFQPDLVWCKVRTAGSGVDHNLFDSVRGVQKVIKSNTTEAELTRTNALSSFDSDGFSFNGSNSAVNSSGDTYVAWNWKAGGTGSSNSDGSVTSTVSANTTSGFSVVKFNVGSSGSNITVGHGLGVVPKMILIKSLTDAYNWDVYNINIGNDKRLKLNTEDPEADDDCFGDTTATSSVFTFKQNHYGNNSDAIAYCFADVPGYSKFGSYKGNGSATDSPFVYTGFKPAFTIIKRADSPGNKWVTIDNKRNTYNGSTGLGLKPDYDQVEESFAGFNVDYLSNGFKLYSSWDGYNNSSGTYIYMVFGQPIISNGGVCATAR